MNTENARLQTYLGDGVYASFDGYHIWLAVNDHTNTVVALEPAVFAALMLYKDLVTDHMKALAAADSEEKEF